MPDARPPKLARLEEWARLLGGESDSFYFGKLKDGIRTGHLPAIEAPGEGYRYWLLKRDDVRAWLEFNELAPPLLFGAVPSLEDVRAAIEADLQQHPGTRQRDVQVRVRALFAAHGLRLPRDTRFRPAWKAVDPALRRGPGRPSR